MVNATVRAIDGDVIVLANGSEPLARRLSEQRNTDVIADACTPYSAFAGGCAATTATPRRPRPDRTPPICAAAAAAGASAPARPAASRRSVPDDGVPLPPNPRTRRRPRTTRRR